MNSTPPNLKQGGIVGRVLLVLGLLGLVFVVMVVFAGARLLRELRTPGHHADLRAQILSSANIARNSEIQVSVPVWLTTLGRVGVSLGDAPDEVKAAMELVHSGSVGVYELDGRTDGEARKNMLATVDSALLERGDWSRVLTVMEDQEVVACYAMDSALEEGNTADVFLMILNERELVIISARAYTEPALQYASSAIRKGLGGVAVGPEKLRRD